MEHFFYEDVFCNDIEDLLMELDMDEDEVPHLPEDWYITCMGSTKEAVFQLTPDWITRPINEERFSEDPDDMVDKIRLVLNRNIDFDKINKLLPRIYYPANKEFKITKADLLDYIK